MTHLDDAANLRCNQLAAALLKNRQWDTAFIDTVRAAWKEATEAERKRGLAIYEKAFEQNWVVQDTIDAIQGEQ